jgi:hypothetical protein
MSRRSRAFGLLAALLVGVALFVLIFGTKESDRYYTTHRTIDKAKTLVLACQAYRKDPKSGQAYPATLADLLHPPSGGEPILYEGANELVDCWGRPLKYALVPNDHGEPEPYVWAERTVNGKTTLIGAKGTADGEITLFGLPD